MNERPDKLRAEGIEMTFAGRGAHDGTAVLCGVEMRAGRGEFVSVIGPSGCGKSTLFSVLAGLLAPTAGHVLIDGERPPTLLGRSGYMQQKDLLMPWRTVLGNVMLGLEVAGVPRAEAEAMARERLATFGLAGFEDRRPDEISGGMRQRAALLRTLLCGHELMLLDEPFGALDALTRQVMQEWLLEIGATDDKTILLITHDVDEAVYLSDRVYVMSGRPGRMDLCVEIELPRPRSLELKSAPEFLAYREQLTKPLYDAARSALREGIGPRT